MDKLNSLWTKISFRLHIISYFTSVKINSETVSLSLLRLVQFEHVMRGLIPGFVYCWVTILVVDTISKQRIKRKYRETSEQGVLPGSVYDKVLLAYEFMISCIVVSWSRVSGDSHHCVHNQRASRLNEVGAKWKLGYQRVWSIWGRWIQWGG